MFGRKWIQMVENGMVWLLAILVFANNLVIIGGGAEDLRIMIECLYSLSEGWIGSEGSKD